MKKNLTDSFRSMFAEKEFHTVIEKNKIWLYFWVDRRGSKCLDKLDFDNWNDAWDFVKGF